MKRLIAVPAVLILSATVALVAPGCQSDSIETDYFYAITNAGILCGYSTIDTCLTVVDGAEMILIEQSILSLGELLGMEYDSTIELLYHVDPTTGQFVYQSFDVDQGQSRFSAEVRIEADGAHCTTSFGRVDQVVELFAGTLLENSLYFAHILRDFADPNLEEKTYPIFDVGDQEVQDVRYSRAGEETIELDGHEYQTIKVDRRNLVTGVAMRFWLDAATGVCVKVLENEGRVIYLADSSLADDLERFVADDYILTSANKSIPDVTGISYMKVRAKIKPTGLIVTPEKLNVPGQRFTGTVEDNLIEGVFEIEHPRYDGAQAPPFPPDVVADAELAAFLVPSEFIESDDSGIVEKARFLTAEATDSWDATRRLSEWVSSEIRYEIPGGGTARGVFETRAGECGGHSVLLAAFCRSVGIPARMVWGVTYVPSQGGQFGQHGWNEIWMGDAGWVPVDATGTEIDFVDSGHIRLGLFESFTTWANAKEFEILDYRVIGATEEATESAAARYAEYLGEYRLAGLAEPAKVAVQDGSLVFEIPDNVALAFGDPGSDGRWPCKLADHVYLTFERDDDGEVVEAQVHELHRLPRVFDTDPVDHGVPEEFRPYLGKYRLAAANAEFTVSYGRGGLRMHHPLEDKTSSLNTPGLDGGWVSDTDRHVVYFERDEYDRVTGLTIDAASRFER